MKDPRNQCPVKVPQVFIEKEESYTSTDGVGGVEVSGGRG